MAEPTVVSVSPASNATGVYLKAPIEIVFDQEIDPTSITLVLEGPDGDRWSGPNFAYWDDPNSDETESILNSPGYKGILSGEFSFSKVDTDNNTVSGIYDYSGQGTLWRTKVSFQPEYPFGPNVEYKVYLYGDEEDGDSINSGVSTRTVYDTEKGANLGEGEAAFYGGYTGTINDKFFVEIIETGETGDVKFQYYKQSDPLIVRRLTTSRKRQLLESGVYVSFSGDHQTGDVFSAVVEPAVRMTSTYYWTFTSGSGSITEAPEHTSSSSVLLGPSSGTTSTVFGVSETSPAARATNLTTDTVNSVTVTFTENIDDSTLAGNITIASEPVNGIWDGNPVSYYEDNLDFSTSVSNNVLTISLTDSSQLYDNNVVYVTLSEDIKNTDGDTLAADYEFYFTTKYSPMYTSIRRIRMDLGRVISGIPDDTINLAIFEASQEAQAILFTVANGGSITNSRFYNWAKHMYVTCLAKVILLESIVGSGGSAKYKRLGDLDVRYDDTITDLLDKARDCMLEYEETLKTAGDISPGTSLKPQMVIRGSKDPDRPAIGRTWEPTSTWGDRDSQIPAANTRSRHSTQRRYKKSYFRRSRWNKRK